MRFKKFVLSTFALSCVLGLNLATVNAQQTASANLSADTNDGNAENNKKPNEKSSDHGFSTTDFLPPEERKSVAPEIDSKVQVKVVINVPHHRNAKNELSFYPYPLQPPKIKEQQKGLPEEYDQLKNMLLTSGYTQRTNVMVAYPYGGWRWQYAFQAALRKSNLGYPHVISEMYGWIDEMMPYVKAECKRSNIAEKERKQRYNRAQEEYNENRVEMETDSVRRGLFPVPVRIQTIDDKQTRWGTSRVLPGSWWLTGTHKVSGLNYYWSLPVEIDSGKAQTIELTEANALLVTGGW